MGWIRNGSSFFLNRYLRKRGKLIKHIKIYYGEHPSQFGVLSRPEIDIQVPVVIAIHGGFWQERYGLEENGSLVTMLGNHGYAVWNIEYRRSGNGGGWPHTFNDVLEAANKLSFLEEKYNIDLSKIVIIGHSAGAQLAIWLAGSGNEVLEIPICGVISLAGVTDLKKMWKIHESKNLPSVVGQFMGGSPDNYKKRYEAASPVEMFSIGTNLLLIHGEMDKHVPVDLSIAYHRKAVEEGNKSTLAIYPDDDHFTILETSSDAMNCMMATLNNWLPPVSKE